MPCSRCGHWTNSFCWYSDRRSDGRPDPSWQWFTRDAGDYRRFWLLVCSPSCRACAWPRSTLEAEDRIERYIHDRSDALGAETFALLDVIAVEFAALRQAAGRALSELDEAWRVLDS